MRDQLLLESSSRADVNALLCQHYGLSRNSELVCPACVYKNWFCPCFIKQSFPSVNSGCRANTPCHLETELSGETKTTILRCAQPRSDWGVTRTSNRVTSNGVTGKRVTAKNTEGKFLRKRVTAKNTEGKFLRKRVTAKNNDRRFSRKRVTN